MEAGREPIDMAGDVSRAVSLLMRRRRRLLSISSSDSQQHCSDCFVRAKMCTTRTSHNCLSVRHRWVMRRSVPRCCMSPPAGCRAFVAVCNVMITQHELPKVHK